MVDSIFYSSTTRAFLERETSHGIANVAQKIMFETCSIEHNSMYIFIIKAQCGCIIVYHFSLVHLEMLFFLLSPCVILLASS